MKSLTIACMLLVLAGFAGAQERITVDMAGTTVLPRRTTAFIVESSVVSPGGVFRLLFPSGEPVTVVLQTREGVPVARGASVVMRLGQMAVVTTVLVPVDSTVRPGSYVLHVTQASGAQQQLTATVSSRDFLSQEIALDRRLTLLRSVPDPEKTRQTRELTELVFSSDPEAVFHTGALGWPLPRGTRESSPFGVRRRFLYSDGSDARTIHVGLDLAAPTGTGVLSSGHGVVRMAEFRIVTGGTVVIEHLPGVYTLYYHLNSISVEPGEIVRTGSIIGSVGATGLATGAHLHWEVRIAGVPVDPVSLTDESLLWPG